MSVRNFWLEADIDGRKTRLSGGPRSKNGGMTIVLYQRHEGAVCRAMTITCKPKGDEELVSEIEIHDGMGLSPKFYTQR